VSPLIRSVAAAEGRTREDALIGCWISPGWSSSVQAPQRPDWPGSGPSERTGHSGLVTVLVARDRGGSTAGVCFYLVDTWCLGLKDAAGPRPDFGRAAGYLGAWDGQCDLAFGRDGKPMYISGPHDDGEKIIRKLRRRLGDGNDDFVHVIPG
jgi:hypothetical protein